MAVYTLAVLLGLLVLGESSIGDEKYDATTLQGDGQVCPPTDQRDAARANISEDIRSLINTSVLPAMQGYGACNCGRPGWTRMAYLDMTDPTQQCPQNWRLNGAPKRTCGRTSSQCNSAIFSNNGSLQYSQVCGRIISYQYGQANAFFALLNNIESRYVDGVSLTHGSPREHIWTFAAALDESVTNRACPCSNINYNGDHRLPFFVGVDYHCETGVPPESTFTAYTFYPDDPLWDGEGCGPTSTCCTFNNPPWFCKELPQLTTDDLEVRICGGNSDQDTPIELIEIYVK